MTLYYETKIENEKIILVNQDFYKKSGDMIELFILEEKRYLVITLNIVLVKKESI